MSLKNVFQCDIISVGVLFGIGNKIILKRPSADIISHRTTFSWIYRRFHRFHSRLNLENSLCGTYTNQITFQ